MKKLIFSVLLASSTFLALESPVLAKDCPPLNAAEITVQDPDRNIKLRTDPQNAGLNVPGAKGTDVTVQPGKPLLIIKNTPAEFNIQDNLCYYPVEFKSGEKHGNVIPGILSHKPYWISDKGIKDYATLKKAGAVTLTPTPSPEQTPQTGSGKANNGFPLLQILAWSIIPVVIGGIAIWAFWKSPYKKNLFAQLGRDLDQEDSNQSRSRGRKGRGTSRGVHSSNPIQELESPDSLTRLISVTTKVQHEVDRNTRHIKGVEALLTNQNQFIQHNNQLLQQNNQLLEKMVKLLEGDRRSSPDSPPAQTEDQKKDSLFGGNDLLIDPTIHPAPQVLQPRLPNVSHQIDDPFYSDVINKFKTSDSYWFRSQINASKLRKVQVTKNSVEGEIDMGGKITKLELDEQNGTLLVYEAANKCWLIPNPVEPKWKRAVTESLFTGTSGTILVRPAKVEALGNNMWQVKEKGEFA
jgi:hypothetical protein